MNQRRKPVTMPVSRVPLRRPGAAAFTLIELSVVLVIIGLIVGGILTGRSLIEQAQIRGTVSAMDHYKQAYNAFVLKYNCVPGDCANASAFGLGWSQPSAGWSGNGDGDGYIYSYSDGYTLPDGALAGREETWDALTHLYNAHLIQDNILYNGGSSHIPESNLPIANGFMFFTSMRPKSPPAWFIMPDKDTNYLFIGTWPTNGNDFSTILPILTPVQAQAIDLKIDDGMPMTGAVKASGPSYTTGPGFNLPLLYSNRGGSGTACVDDRATPFVYYTNGWTSNGVWGLCNIHVPVN
jgi:prepilin-type N-terminal cleavage/methylation domain-containing protein